MGLRDQLREGWIKSHSLLMPILKNSGKDKDICFAVGRGKASSCDTRVLDGLATGRAGKAGEGKMVEMCTSTGAQDHSSCPQMMPKGS